MAKLGWVVDADGHYAEVPEQWARHLPLTRRKAVPKIAVEKDGVERFTIGDHWVMPSRGGKKSTNQMGKMGIGDGLNPRVRGSKKPIAQGRRLAQAHPGASSGKDTQILGGINPGTRVFIDLPPWAKKQRE